MQSTEKPQTPNPKHPEGELMNQPRLPWTSISPKAYKAMAAVGATTADSALGPGLMDLVQTRMHGESWQRINSLSTWRETGLYSQRERAALAWAETMTRLVDHHVGRDAEFDELKGQFSDQEIVELCWTIAQINAWNRMAISMLAPVADRPIE